jgi:hypothetical protein
VGTVSLTPLPLNRERPCLPIKRQRGVRVGMVLTAEQHLRIASVYDKAAADKMGIPPQQRAAFARKAKWIRMLARIRAKKDAAVAAAPQARPPDEPRPQTVSHEHGPAVEHWAPKAKYQTLAERLKTARAALPVA